MELCRAGRYAAQRRAGFAQLRFVDGLETEYREYRAPTIRRRLATLFRIAGFGLFAYLLVDRLAPQPLMTADSIKFLLIAVGVVILMAFATRRPHRAQPLDLIVATGVTAFGLCMVGSVIAADPQLPFGSIIVTLMATYFVAGMPTRKAAICALLISLAYVVGAVLTLSLHYEMLGYKLLFLLLTNAVGLFGEYHIEHEARRTFLLQMELRDLAQHDGMTRLFNRRAFRRQLQLRWRQAVRDRKPIGLMLIDMDRLKQINDGEGHMAGDHCLRALAALLRRRVQRPLDMAGRLGGDEFVVAWYDTDAARFEQLAELIRRDVDAAWRGWSGLPHFTVSIGAVHVWPHGEITAAEALRLADNNLYAVKNGSRNGVAFSSYPPPPASADPLLSMVP